MQCFYHYIGHIEKKVCHGRSGIMYLPQKPYLTEGSLRQQVLHVNISNVIMYNDKSWFGMVNSNCQIIFFF